MGSSENCADISVVRGQIIAGAGREVRGQLFGVVRCGGGGSANMTIADRCNSVLTDGV